MTVHEDKADKDFIGRARAVLDADLGSIDGATRSKLTQARYSALESRRFRQRSYSWVPAGVFTSALLAALLLAELPPGGSEPSYDLLLDLDLITAAENLDMLEDLEFYLWLESNDMAS